MKTRKLTEDEFNRILDALFNVCRDMTEIKAVLREYSGINRVDIKRLKNALKAMCVNRSKEKWKKSLKNWKELHKEHLKEYKKKWRELNRDKVREYTKNWNELNKNKVKDINRRYYERNREKKSMRDIAKYHSKEMPKIYLRNYLNHKHFSKKQKAVYTCIKCWLPIQQFFVGV